MSVYRKLNEARLKFHQLKLTKTGLNKFAGYNYFELGDFLIPALKVFSECGLCAIVSFGEKMATMSIIDVDQPSDIGVFQITSPMGSAALKGCHEVQNIGAVETYQRRYLWVAALEIVEHDALDATAGKPDHKGIPASFKSSPTMGVMATLPASRQAIITDCADAMRERYSADDLIGAFEIYTDITDVEEKVALWGALGPDSKLRSSIKKYGESLKLEKETA